MIFQPDYQKTSHESIQSHNKGYLNGNLDVSHSKLFDIPREFTMLLSLLSLNSSLL